MSRWTPVSARCAVALLALAPTTAAAHVMLDSPLGGQTLTGGESFDILWHPRASHGPTNWDLMYSTSSAEGPWVDIILDIPESNPDDTRSTRSFEWAVPNIDAAEAWVRVVQNNQQDIDYTSTSPESFSISTAGLPGDYNNDGAVDAVDYAVWRNGDPSADGNGDTVVDQQDYVFWREHYGSTSESAASASPAPEPAGFAVIVAALAGGLIFRRR